MGYQSNLSDLYSSCTLCPRKCGVNRRKGEKGFCGELDSIRIACACLHRGEEPVLSGTGGSGTVFFVGCTLQCGFCQNHQISRNKIGETVTIEECAKIFIMLQEKGAENINLVTGTQFIPGIIETIILARKNGLIIPALWNSSGYEEEECLGILNPYIDIWVSDIKILQPDLSKTLLKQMNYPDKVKKAVLFMQKQKNIVIKQGIMKSGVIIRHLVLPGFLSSTKEVLLWYKQNLYPGTILSLMFQYIPLNNQEYTDKGNLSHYVSKTDYEEALGFLEEIGIEDGFIQEPVYKNEWIPDFTRENPFPPDWAVPVWHYCKGFL